MPVNFCVVLEKPVKGVRTPLNFPELAIASVQLDKAARKHKLVPLEEFMDLPKESLAILDQSDIEIGDDERERVASYCWAPADKGLQCVQALKAVVPKIKGLNNAKAVSEELAKIEDVLAMAMKKNIAWCLTVDVDGQK